MVGQKTPFDPAVAARLATETNPRDEQLSPPNTPVGIRKDWAIALYTNARDAYGKCIENEWQMRNIVLEARGALRDSERACERLRADTILNADDEQSGIYTLAHATNDKTRRAALDNWEQTDPYYIDALRARDQAQMEVNSANRDMLVCIRSLTILRLDMEFAIALLEGAK